MKTTIHGHIIEGTPEEIAQLLDLLNTKPSSWPIPYDLAPIPGIIPGVTRADRPETA